MTDRDRLAALLRDAHHGFPIASLEKCQHFADHLLAAGVTLPPELEKPMVSEVLYDAICEAVNVREPFDPTERNSERAALHALLPALAAEAGYVLRPVLTEGEESFVKSLHTAIRAGRGSFNWGDVDRACSIIRRLTGGGA